MCGEFTSNGHMPCNYPSMSGLRPSYRYNIAIQPLLSRLERNNGGRWENIAADCGNKPNKTIDSLPLLTATPLDCHPPLCRYAHPYGRRLRRQLRNDSAIDSLTSCPVVLEEIPPLLAPPPSHKLELISLLDPMFVEHSDAQRR
jgi:hypothetical protein